MQLWTNDNFLKHETLKTKVTRMKIRYQKMCTSKREHVLNVKCLRKASITNNICFRQDSYVSVWDKETTNGNRPENSWTITICSSQLKNVLMRYRLLILKYTKYTYNVYHYLILVVILLAWKKFLQQG